MSSAASVPFVTARDPDEALISYFDTLGCEVGNDVKRGETGWVRSASVDQPADIPLSEIHDVAAEYVRSQDQHPGDALADESHCEALGDGALRWRHPLAAAGWYRQADKVFAEMKEQQ